MTTPNVWTAVEQLAGEWSKSPLVQRLAVALPSNDPPPGDVTSALQWMDAGLNGVVSACPLLNTAWEPLAEQLPLVSVTPEVRHFMRSVVPIGMAAEWSTAWLRSRIPGYPLIPAPQLAPQGLRRNEEYGDRLPWRRQMMKAGLQYNSSPLGSVAGHLRLKNAAEINSATVNLADALSETVEWEVFRRVNSALEPEDRIVLRSACRNLNTLLSADAVDAFEPDTMHRRQQFRRERTEETIEALTGRPRAFADAFTRLDDLVDLVAIEILGQIACFGAPQLVESAEIINLTATHVRFLDSDGFLPHLGSLVRLSDPLVDEVIRIDSTTVDSDRISQTVVTVGGQRLPGSESATG